MKDVKQIIKDMEKAEVRRLITEDKVRPDGRDLHEIRDLDSEVAYLPRAHGSGLFTRGQPQALSVLTLGPLAEHQVIDGLSSEEEKRLFTTITSQVIQSVKQDVRNHLAVAKLDTVL